MKFMYKITLFLLVGRLANKVESRNDDDFGLRSNAESGFKNANGEGTSSDDEGWPNTIDSTEDFDADTVEDFDGQTDDAYGDVFSYRFVDDSDDDDLDFDDAYDLDFDDDYLRDNDGAVEGEEDDDDDGLYSDDIDIVNAGLRGGHHRKLFLCDATETIVFLVEPRFEEWLQEKYAGYTHRISRRKRLRFNGADITGVSGCTISAKIGITLQRRLRRDGHGFVKIRATIDMGRLVEDVFGTRDTSNLGDVKEILTNLNLNPNMKPDKVCLKNIEVYDLRLSRVARVTEKHLFLPIANSRVPNEQCFQI